MNQPISVFLKKNWRVTIAQVSNDDRVKGQFAATLFSFVIFCRLFHLKTHTRRNQLNNNKKNPHRLYVTVIMIIPHNFITNL